jgi:hypothetical protein
MYLSSNQELHADLLRLARGLKARGAIELSEVVTYAGRQAASMSTEFLGESRIAPRRVLSTGRTVWEPSEQADIEDVVRRLTAAINRWPQRSG